MKIREILYFAPDISFNGLDFNSPEIVEKFRKRLEGFYLAPARLHVDRAEGFPAMVLLVSCMDAIGRYASNNKRGTNRDRFVGWLQTALPHIFSKIDDATQFYLDVRCGAVHEARVKMGCVFTFEIGNTIFVEDGIMAVNPRLLAEEVTNALDQFCKTVASDAENLAKFQKLLNDDFKNDLRSVVV
jgi:hypothetical protein